VLREGKRRKKSVKGDWFREVKVSAVEEKKSNGPKAHVHKEYFRNWGKGTGGGAFQKNRKKKGKKKSEHGAGG